MLHLFFNHPDTVQESMSESEEEVEEDGGGGEGDEEEGGEKEEEEEGVGEEGEREGEIRNKERYVSQTSVSATFHLLISTPP